MVQKADKDGHQPHRNSMNYEIRNHIKEEKMFCMSKYQVNIVMMLII